MLDPLEVCSGEPQGSVPNSSLFLDSISPAEDEETDVFCGVGDRNLGGATLLLTG